MTFLKDITICLVILLTMICGYQFIEACISLNLFRIMDRVTILLISLFLLRITTKIKV